MYSIKAADFASRRSTEPGSSALASWWLLIPQFGACSSPCSRLTTLLLPAAAGATVAVSAAPDACGPAFNWFPTAAEIGQDVVVNNKTCTGKQVCNFPRVWTKNNQTSYMPQLGTSLSNGLMKVAFKQYGNQPPRLFFTPVSEFLEAGADVSACLAARSQPPTTRRLLAGAKVSPAT